MIHEITEEQQEELRQLKRAILDARKAMGDRCKSMRDEIKAKHYSDYKVGDKVLVKVGDDYTEKYTEEEAYIKNMAVSDDEMLTGKEFFFITFWKVNKDGSQSKHTLYSVREIIRKL